jgi:predicted ATP-grasp superfamily ATP-dependent carboligase
MLLPMTELTTSLLLNRKDAFPDTVIPFPQMSTIDALANKCTLMRTAESLNITIPRTWYVDDPASVATLRDKLTFPVVLKPGKSWLLYADEWHRVAVKFPQTYQSLEQFIHSEPGLQAHPFLIQECVTGEGQGIFALYDHGKPLVFFAHRRLREKPPRGGVSVLSESVAADPRLIEHARALLDTAAWHGVAMVEFIQAKDGTYYLMEVNTRFWGSLQLAIDAGVDFPWLLYQTAFGSPPERELDYRSGVRLRWLLGDLDSLYLTLRDRHFPVKTKLSTLLQFLKPAPFRTRHEVNRLSDLGPFWCELKHYFKDITQ